MRSAKKIIAPSMFTALLIGAQLALSGISGVELVTVLLLTFAYCFGITQGLLVANAFSLLRCFIFGFYPSVVLLYLVYYNLFVVVFGLFGMFFKREYSVPKHAAIVALAVILTISFTLIDDFLTPLVCGFSANATKVYFTASLPVAARQSFCAFVTVAVLFPPLLKAMNGLRHTFLR